MDQRLLRHDLLDKLTYHSITLEMYETDDSNLVELVFYIHDKNYQTEILTSKSHVAELVSRLSYWINIWSQPMRDSIEQGRKEDEEWLKKYPPRKSVWKRMIGR